LICSISSGGIVKFWGGIDEPSDNFAKERQLKHLKEKNLVPRNISLEQYNKWIAEDNIDLSEIFKYEISDVKSGINDILSLAVADGHIEDSIINIDHSVLVDEYEKITQPLKDLSERQQELKEKIKLSKKIKEFKLSDKEQEEYSDIQARIVEYRNDHDLEIKRIEALFYLDRMKNLNMKELETKNLFIAQKKITFINAFKVIEEVFKDNPTFISDIGRIRELLEEGNRQIFQGARLSRSQLKITDRVDLETHLFIGERPVESCQNYNSSDSFNYGLLSYISDPAIKIIQVWNENGNIIARSIIRLMEDDLQNPQLFMERVYSVNANPKLKEIMVRFAIQKAKSMEIDMHTDEKDYKDIVEDNFGNKKISLYSRGSRSPYTYTDSGGGKVLNGIFKVETYK
jgi:hypothetical protein